jgi:hypothetical protein
MGFASVPTQSRYCPHPEIVKHVEGNGKTGNGSTSLYYSGCNHLHPQNQVIKRLDEKGASLDAPFSLPSLDCFFSAREQRPLEEHRWSYIPETRRNQPLFESHHEATTFLWGEKRKAVDHVFLYRARGLSQKIASLPREPKNRATLVRAVRRSRYQLFRHQLADYLGNGAVRGHRDDREILHRLIGQVCEFPKDEQLRGADLVLSLDRFGR